MITGSKKEGGVRYVGMFEGTPILINPTKQELRDKLGIETDEEPVYLSKNDTGDTRLRLVVWLQDVKTGIPFRNTLTIENKVRVSAAGNTQYINTAGMSSWADTPNNLKDWFKERDYREARIGEEKLYNFLRNWLHDLNYTDTRTILDMDWSKLMRGDVTELRDVMKNFPANTVTTMATVVEKDGENGPVYYQGVYNGEFLPGTAMKFFRIQGGKKPKVVEKFIQRVTDGQYGCKDLYTLEELKVFDAATFTTNSTSAIINKDDASY